jgi:hypothetical protein
LRRNKNGIFNKNFNDYCSDYNGLSKRNDSDL